MHPSRTSFCAALSVTLVSLASISLSPALGQELAVDALGYRTPYRFAKPAITEAFRPGTSLEAREFAVIKAAQTAYGSRARTVLGGSEKLLARVAGGEDLARRFAVSNRSVRKGALRAARVAVALDNDPRFRVLALDQPVYDRRGNLLTDRDIVYRHRGTGMRGRIEVKEVSPRSQATSQLKYRRQIRLMAQEQQRTGQPQAFVNRLPVISSLRRYAAQQGVLVFDNVATSSRNMVLPNQTSISQVLDELDQVSNTRARTRQMGIGFGVAFTAMEGINSAIAWRDYAQGEGTLAQAGYRTSMTAAGASFAVKGLSLELLARVNASSRAAVYLRGISRYAGTVGLVFTGATVGIRGYQYLRGEITTRQFITETSTAAGGIAGGIAGAWAGGAIGGLGGPFAIVTVPVGAIVGGVAGAWAGSTLVGQGIDSIYGRMDEAEKVEIRRQLTQYYQAQVKGP